MQHYSGTRTRRCGIAIPIIHGAGIPALTPLVIRHGSAGGSGSTSSCRLRQLWREAAYGHSLPNAVVPRRERIGQALLTLLSRVEEFAPGARPEQDAGLRLFDQVWADSRASSSSWERCCWEAVDSSKLPAALRDRGRVAELRPPVLGRTTPDPRRMHRRAACWSCEGMDFAHCSIGVGHLKQRSRSSSGSDGPSEPPGAGGVAARRRRLRRVVAATPNTRENCNGNRVSRITHQHRRTVQWQGSGCRRANPRHRFCPLMEQCPSTPPIRDVLMAKCLPTALVLSRDTAPGLRQAVKRAEQSNQHSLHPCASVVGWSDPGTEQGHGPYSLDEF